MRHTRLYRRGVLEAKDFPAAQISDYLEQPDTVVWLDLCEPDQADLEVVSQEFGLHPLAVEDAIQQHERPKLDRYQDHAFLTAYAVSLDPTTGRLQKSELAAFIECATTGRARRCGWFDAVVVRYATIVNGFASLAMTKLDVLDGCRELKVCTGYRHEGQLYRHMPADLDTLTDCEPIYKRFKGWSSSTTGATSYRGLPTEAKRYLQYIEESAACPIDIVSTGSKRDATIILRNPLKARGRTRSR